MRRRSDRQPAFLLAGLSQAYPVSLAAGRDDQGPSGSTNDLADSLQSLPHSHISSRRGYLRDRLNASAGPEDVLAILESEHLVFTYSEFDDAYHNLLVQCQEEEQAEQLKEFKMWWDLIRTIPA